ncbi:MULTISPECIES: type IV secretory system conjugative DNA transfer family protein [Leptolyngbya]|uniref:type IV secretory system conjugative DNA transfer family protein n=1 Tax=Leptolyngbya TaxID=47251 RepID=UPI0016881C59|nr:type IV secretion system DNA-binding domain-containing protein [Leptolyngbya sp. FACHB-1624]MBD1859304.1 type IV secretory system conjugative DNA transfer family protein [Leptolyngbya sp. FACHB-1624]
MSQISLDNYFSPLLKLFQGEQAPGSWLLVSVLVVVIVLLRISGNRKGKITTGRMVGTAEKLAAVNTALKQIRERKHDRITLWCGKPRSWLKGSLGGVGTRLQTLLGTPPTLYLPDAQRSTLVIGTPGSGKTASVIDSALESAFVQGFPVILYDKKGSQMQLHAALAARYGYQVWVFAPGEPYSGVLNPLDFMRDGYDSVMAGEIGQVINRNASKGGKSDEFFSTAGDLLAKALLQLAKVTQHADMAMVYALLRLPNLVERLDHAVQSRQLDEWIATSFNQFLSAKDAEKTISGILTTAAATFSNFIQADLLRSFIGESDIPTQIQGRQMIVFKLDDARRGVIGSLLAAALHLVIVANLSQPRTDPLIISLDELPSLKLERLPQWINEYRSNGACFLLGIQSLNQLYEQYGEKLGNAIAYACSTHILFNPGDFKTAEEYSKRYGEKEITVRNRSTSQSTGVHQNRSTSWNESLQKISILTPDEILRFEQGKCVITNPAYRSRGEGSILYLLKIEIAQSEFAYRKRTEQLWEQQVKPALQRRVNLLDRQALTEALYARIEAAEKLLPLLDLDEERSSK